MNHNEINSRSKIILEIIEEKLEQDLNLDSSFILDGYKASFLLSNRNIELYIRSFKSSGLEFDINAVEQIWNEYSYALDGFKGLSYGEREILNEGLERILSY